MGRIADMGVGIMKRVFISIGILVLICFGGLFLYNVAYSEGEADGYRDGYDQGNIAGQEWGYGAGHIEGFRLGTQQGYDEGYLAGKADGYEEGVGAGYEEGIEIGYEEGVSAALGHGYTIKDPTYKQAIKFLKEDETDKNKFVEDIYVCSHFTRDVCNNAENEGLRCAFVEIRYSDGGHSIIAFNTTDEGLVYFEPQSDEIVKPVVGKRYYKCVEPKPGYRYEKPSFDDTIVDILVIW